MEVEESSFITDNNGSVNEFNMTVSTNERQKFVKQDNHNISWQ